MLPAHLYQYFYLAVIVIITFFCTSSLLSIDVLRKEKPKFFAFIVLIFFILFIGFRPIDKAFIDMSDMSFVMGLRQGQDFTFDWNAENLIHDNLYNYWCAKEFPQGYYFFIYSAIYFSGIYIAARKLFPENLLLAFVIYLAAFSTFSYGTNGIKAGVAASLFLIAVAYREKLLIAIPFLLLSLGFHHSMVLPIGAFAIAYFFHNRKYFLAFWFVCLILSAFHVTYFQELFAGYTDEHGAEYLEILEEREEVETATGFRIDFILYSAIPMFLGFFLAEKKNIKSPMFDFIWCVYTFCNGIWLLCTYASFTNRIAYLSWSLYPILLAFPFLAILWDREQHKYVKYMAWGHLGFTLFMNLIYYSK